jgi:lipopolysaccharide export system permease protein
MKILYRSILKELFVTFIISLASLNFILMMEKLLRLSRFLSGVGTSAADMIKIILLLQPQLFLLTIPMALLLSTLLTYGRLNLDNELVILRNSGMNLRNISMPVFILGILCFAANLAVSFSLGPVSTAEMRKLITNIIKVRTPLALEEGRFNTSFQNTTIIVRGKRSDDTVRGIFIYDNRNKKEPRVITAKEGRISVQEDFMINLSLLDGYMNITKGKSVTELFFNKYNMVLGLKTDSPSVKNAELTPGEIYRKIPTEDKRHRLGLYVELHRRVSLPLLCLILVFFGPPLATKAGKSGKLGGLTVGLAVFTIYYMLLIYGENLVKAEKLPHYLGSWISTVVLGISAFLLFMREGKK